MFECGLSLWIYNILCQRGHHWNCWCTCICPLAHQVFLEWHYGTLVLCALIYDCNLYRGYRNMHTHIAAEGSNHNDTMSAPHTHLSTINRLRSPFFKPRHKQTWEENHLIHPKLPQVYVYINFCLFVCFFFRKWLEFFPCTFRISA